MFNSILATRLLEYGDNIYVLGDAGSGVSTLLAGIAVEAYTSDISKSIMLVNATGGFNPFSLNDKVTLLSNPVIALRQVLQLQQLRESRVDSADSMALIIIDDLERVSTSSVCVEMLVKAIERSKNTNVRFVMGCHYDFVPEALSFALRNHVSKKCKIKREGQSHFYLDDTGYWSGYVLQDMSELSNMM